jgi:hypothetical protein
MNGRTPTLRRRAGIEDPEMLEALHLRNVRMAVDHGITVLEACGEACLPSKARPGVVNHSDADVLDLDDLLLRQRLLQRRLVHVPVHALERRPDRTQLLEDARCDEVAAVQQKLGACDEPHALVRQRPRAPRQVRIGDDGDADQEAGTGSFTTADGSRRKRPAFQTSSPSA